MNRRKRRGLKTNSTGRSISEQYANLSYDFMRSIAWRSLSGSSVKVWIEIRSRYNGSNNGRLILSQDEAARILGIGKTTVGRALKELQAKGFLKLCKAGKWLGRMASEWAVTTNAINGIPPTNDWRHWHPRKFNAEVSTNSPISGWMDDATKDANPCPDDRHNMKNQSLGSVADR